MQRLMAVLAVIAMVLALTFVGCSNSSESGEHGNSGESGERDSSGESGERDSSGESGERDSSGESGERDSSGESGEHGSNGESGEHGSGGESGEGDEESGAQFAPNETFDQVRAGARLILSYDSTANAFIGRVENTTGGTLIRVRVEVHLSNGIELGPTTPVDLAPGAVIDVALPAGSRPFASWSAHPEVG